MPNTTIMLYPVSYTPDMIPSVMWGMSNALRFQISARGLLSDTASTSAALVFDMAPAQIVNIKTVGKGIVLVPLGETEDCTIDIYDHLLDTGINMRIR